MTRVLSWLGLKKVTSDEPYLRATVTTAEAATSRWSSNNAESLVARFVSTTAACANFNANNLASHVFRLYKPIGGKAKGRTRKVAKSARDFQRTLPAMGIKAVDQARSEGEFEEVLDHPALDLIRRPNPVDKGWEYWQLHHVYRELTGDAYDLKIYEGGGIQLRNLASQHVRISVSTSEFIDGYYYGRNRAQETFFDVEDVMHDRRAKSPMNPYYGISPLETILPEHDTRQSMTQYTGALFKNMARPEFAISFKAGATDVEIQRIKDQWVANNTGINNLGKLIVMTGDAELKQLQAQLKEMEYDTGRKSLASDIAMAFGVPETFLHPNDGALSQLRSAMILYGRSTLLPLCTSHAEFLTVDLLPLFPGTDGWWISFDNPVPADEAAEATRLVAVVNGGILTPNEARAEMGWEQSDDPAADTLRSVAPAFPMLGSAPVDQAAKPSDVAAVAANPDAAVQDTALNGAQLSAAADLLAQVAAGKLPLAAAQALFSAAFPLVPPEKVAEIFAPLEGFEPTPEPTKQGADNGSNADNVGSGGGADKPPADESPVSGNPEGAKVLAGGGRTAGNGGKASRSGSLDTDNGGACGCGEACSDAGVKRQSVLLLGYSSKGVEVSPYKPDAPSSLVNQLDAVFKAQRDSIIAAMNAAPMGFAKGGPMLAPGRKADEAAIRAALERWGVKSIDEWTRRMMKVVEPHANASLIEAAAIGVKQIEAMAAALDPAGDRVPFSFSETASRKWVERNTAALLDGLESVNRTTADALAATLAEGIGEGESIGSLTDRVRAAFDATVPSGEPISTYRAGMITRTETARAQTNGTLGGWDATGVVQGKKWLLAGGACFAAGSQVLSVVAGKAVSVSIDSLRPNDMVIGHTGRPCRVVGIKSRTYDGDIVIGDGFAATPDHRFLTSDGWLPIGQYAVNARAHRFVDFLVGKAKNIPAAFAKIVGLSPVFAGDFGSVVPVDAVTENDEIEVSHNKVNDPSFVHGPLLLKGNPVITKGCGHLDFDSGAPLERVNTDDVAVAGTEIVSPAVCCGNSAGVLVENLSASEACAFDLRLVSGVSLARVGCAESRVLAPHGAELLVATAPVVPVSSLKNLLAPLAGLFGKPIDARRSRCGSSDVLTRPAAILGPSLDSAWRYVFGIAAHLASKIHGAIVTRPRRITRGFRGLVYDIEVDSDHSFLLACGLVAHNCEFCESAAAEYENKVVPLEAPFYRKGSTITGTDGGTMALDFTDIDGPPLHPNDRCALVPEVRLA